MPALFCGLRRIAPLQYNMGIRKENRNNEDIYGLHNQNENRKKSEKVIGASCLMCLSQRQKERRYIYEKIILSVIAQSESGWKIWEGGSKLETGGLLNKRQNRLRKRPASGEKRRQVIQ